MSIRFSLVQLRNPPKQKPQPQQQQRSFVSPFAIPNIRFQLGYPSNCCSFSTGKKSKVAITSSSIPKPSSSSTSTRPNDRSPSPTVKSEEGVVMRVSKQSGWWDNLLATYLEH